MNGLQFQTNSQADQIHIRVTATTETIHHDDYENSPPPKNIMIVNGVSVGDDRGYPMLPLVPDTEPHNNGSTPKYTTTTYANPIKLIITTSGALGHHNHPHYHEAVMTTGPDTAYGGGGGYTINDDVEDNAAYDEAASSAADDDLSNNLDLATLLAHHEANIDTDDIGINPHFVTLKSTATSPQTPPPPSLSEQGAGMHDEGMVAEDEVLVDEPVLVEIMSDSILEMVGGGGGGGRLGDNGGSDDTVAQFHDDFVVGGGVGGGVGGEEQQQVEEEAAATVKVSLSISPCAQHARNAVGNEFNNKQSCRK